MNALKKEFSSGFEVLGFPCNQFAMASIDITFVKQWVEGSFVPLTSPYYSACVCVCVWGGGYSQVFYLNYTLGCP